jgi:tetratricopeptide (TPR) repeat protein
MDNDRMDDVVSLTRKWIERHPDDWLGYYYHGKAHLTMQMGQFNTPVSDFGRVLELKPDDNATRLLLANAYMKNNQYQEGYETFEKYLETQPDDLDGLYGKAWCLFNLTRIDEAQATVDRMLKLDSKNPQAYGLLMKIERQARNHPRKALEALDKALEYGPKDRTLAALKYELMKNVLKMDKEAEEYKAKVETEISGTEEALNKLISQIRDNLHNADLRYEAGKRCLELGRQAEAGHWFDSALRIDPNHLKTWKTLAEYWEKKAARETDPDMKIKAADAARKYRRRANELRQTPAPEPQPKDAKRR